MKMKLKPAPKSFFSIFAVDAFGDTLAVAANWRQASCPVYTYGDRGWVSTQHQVADFRHSPMRALWHEVREYIATSEGMPSDEVDEELIASVLSHAKWVV